MKIGRRYVLINPPTTNSQAVDLFQFNGAAGKVYRIISHAISCTDTTIATGQMLSLRARYLPATVSNGSGGTGSLTPSAVDPGDAACSSTGNFINNTSKATTGGTAVIVWEGSCHLYQGHFFNYELQDICPIIIPSTAFVFELLSTVSGTVDLTGVLTVEEIG